MKKVLAAVIGGLFLSGCALPVPLQVASWALDGLSLLATKKSITDHGISIVAQQDCALWRGVTEGEVCREDDPMALIADRGDVVEGVRQDDQQSSLVTSFATSQSGQTQQPKPVDSVSWKAESEVAAVPADETVEPIVVETVASNAGTPTPVAPEALLIDTQGKQVPQWQLVSQEAATIAPETDDLTTYSATPGDYFVIGSFGVWDNAKRFAAKHLPLEAQILAANVADYRVFRIVVGPYNDINQSALRSSIRGAGVEDIWAVRVPADEITLAWRSSVASTELASISVD